MWTEFLERRCQPCEFILRHTVDHAMPNARNVSWRCTLEQTPTLWRHLCIGRTAVILVSHSFDQALLQHPLHPPGESAARESKSRCEVTESYSATRRLREHRQQLIVATINTESMEVHLYVMQNIPGVEHEASPRPQLKRAEPLSPSHDLTRSDSCARNYFTV